MSHINLSKAHSTVKYDGFDGISDAKVLTGEGGAQNIMNFRLRSDGALERRDGFELLMQFPEKVRAIHSINDYEMLVLSGNTIYNVNPIYRTMTPYESTINTSEGDASFFSYGGRLHLFDGSEMYTYHHGYLFYTEGYVPLYGKNWDPLKGGAVNEPLNMLSSRMRVSYKIPDKSLQTFIFPHSVLSIDAVYLNGSYISSPKIERLTHNEFKTTSIFYAAEDEITFWVSISDLITERETIISCLRAASFGDGAAGSNKLLAVFYDGEDKSIIYPSRGVPEADFKTLERVYTDISRIYIVKEDARAVNDGQGEVLSVCQKDDGLMVFTRDRAFMLKNQGDGQSSLARVSSSTGCTSKNGSVIAEDTPITVSYYGIFKWDPSSYEEGEYSASCISAPINDMLNEEFYQLSIVHHNRKKGEIWFSDPPSYNSAVFVYSLESKAWFRYSGISANFFFECGGETGFFMGKDMYLFTRGLEVDQLSYGNRSIAAKFESGIMMLGEANVKKRLSRCILRTSPGVTLTLTVTDAEGRSTSFDLTDGSGERMGYIEKRLSLHRSRYYSFSLETSERAVIYSIIFVAAD